MKLVIVTIFSTLLSHIALAGTDPLFWVQNNESQNEIVVLHCPNSREVQSLEIDRDGNITLLDKFWIEYLEEKRLKPWFPRKNGVPAIFSITRTMHDTGASPYIGINQNPMVWMATPFTLFSDFLLTPAELVVGGISSLYVNYMNSWMDDKEKQFKKFISDYNPTFPLYPEQISSDTYEMLFDGFAHLSLVEHETCDIQDLDLKFLEKARDYATLAN